MPSKSCHFRRTRCIGQTSTLPHCFFQNVKDTDCTDLPDGMTVTITSGPNDIQQFFFFTPQIVRLQKNPLQNALLLFAAFDLDTKQFSSSRLIFSRHTLLFSTNPQCSRFSLWETYRTYSHKQKCDHKMILHQQDCQVLLSDATAGAPLLFSS